MRLRPLLIAAVLTGAGAGTAVALADEPERQTPPPSASAAPVPREDALLRIDARDVQVVGWRSDPGGGPPWVVRSFVTGSGKRFSRCQQLGREVDGQFGWLAGDAPFRRVGTVYGASPILCGGRQLLRGGANLSRTSLLSGGAGVAQVARTVVWGRVASTTKAFVLDGRGTLRPVQDGVILDVRVGGRLGGPLHGTLISADGTRRAFGRPGDPTAPPGRLRPQSGTTRVAARAPDPAGGPAWGVLTGFARDGRVCTSAPGRLVGDQLAGLGPDPGTATLAPFGRTPVCATERLPNARTPLRLDVALFSYPDADRVGSAQLRRLTGRTVLVARATSDVATVTLTTSRGVRTLVPDPRTHVVVDVYDGSFPGEQVRATARLRSGRTVTLTQSAGG
jgi:hypothetical protein